MTTNTPILPPFVIREASQVKLGDSIWYYDGKICVVEGITDCKFDGGVILTHTDGSVDTWDYTEELRVLTGGYTSQPLPSADEDLRVLVVNMARELAATRKEVTRLTAANAALQAKVDALTPPTRFNPANANDLRQMVTGEDFSQDGNSEIDEEFAPARPLRFKIGESVEISNPRPEFSRFKGQWGIVREFNFDHRDYKVKVGGEWFLGFDDCELSAFPTEDTTPNGLKNVLISKYYPVDVERDVVYADPLKSANAVYLKYPAPIIAIKGKRLNEKVHYRTYTFAQRPFKLSVAQLALMQKLDKYAEGCPELDLTPDELGLTLLPPMNHLITRVFQAGTRTHFICVNGKWQERVINLFTRGGAL